MSEPLGSVIAMTVDDLAPGFDLAPSWTVRLNALDWLYDNGGDNAGTIVRLGPLLDRELEDAQALAAELRDFERRGWVRLQEALAFEGWSCVVDPSGIDFIEAVRQRRGDTVGRRRAVRDAFLRWLYDFKVAGNAHPVITDFASTPYAFYYGHPFTEREIVDATDWLKEQGYIKGQGSWSGGIPRPSITTKGERAVEQGRSVNDAAPASAAADVPSLHINVTGSHNLVAANSPGASQSLIITEDNRRQVLTVADALAGALQALGLDAEKTVEAETVIRDLREVSADSSPDAGRLRRLLSKAQEVAVAGTGSAVGQGIVLLAEQALQGLGLA